ncbi:MAG TPA: caspase family protein [Pyrinomonadaceae bacterium]|nr:caspase family protein [Pyrinomonadaceae bacterium]
MTSFGWLHLTDLHLGMDQQSGWLPAVEDKFFEDLSRLYEKTQPWDLVIFTGDLTFQGSADEFKRVDDFLGRLWARFRQLGANPSLVAVPGNHDLVRPDLDKDLAAKLLRNSWDTDEGIRKQFWANPECTYRQTITTAFKNYSRWWDKTQFKLPTAQPGELPGDFSAILRKGDASLGIVGLNSSFLQLSGGPYKSKLAVDPIQFQKACEGNGPYWVKQHNTCLLLTHQPPDWLNEDAESQLELDISSYFDAHLFGHMHESRYEAHAPAGTPESRCFQATSLFGVDEFEDSPGHKRRHGYAIGRIELEGETGRLTIWPRLANRVGNKWNYVDDWKDIFIQDEHTLPREFTLKKALPSLTLSPTVNVGAPESNTADQEPLTNRWAIVVGVNDYKQFSKLQYCRQDAKDMASAFREKLQFHQVFEFHEEAEPEFQPTRDCILQKLYQLRYSKECKPEDLLVFYFSGHGINEGGKDYLLPINADLLDVDTFGIRVKDLVKILKGFGCANTVLFIDACRDAVQGAKGVSAIGEDSTTIVSDAGMIAFFSCDPRERSYEIETLEHGSFTYCILEAIQRTDYSTVDELNSYLIEQVPKINDKYKKRPQRPRSVIIPPTRGNLTIFPRSRGQSQGYQDLKDILFTKMEQGEIDVTDWVSAVGFLDSISGKARLYANDTRKLGAIKGLCYEGWLPKTFSEHWKKLATRTQRLPVPDYGKNLPSLQ